MANRWQYKNATMDKKEALQLVQDMIESCEVKAIKVEYQIDTQEGYWKYEFQIEGYIDSDVN